jgi:transposase-like protein
MPRKRSRPWTVADARAALTELAASGLSVSTFARREGLHGDRLYRWRRRFAGESKGPGVAGPAPTPALIEIHPNPRRAEPVEIILASGVTLRVAETIDPSALAHLVMALR